MLHEHEREIFDCKRHPLLPIQIMCYSVTRERKKFLSQQISAPFEIIQGIIQENKKEQSVHMKGYSFGLEFGMRAPHKNYDGPIWSEKKEVPTMQVIYNGFTGELVKLERHTVVCCAEHYIYDLSIYDRENQATISFSGVELEDVKFPLREVEVSFGG